MTSWIPGPLDHTSCVINPSSKVLITLQIENKTFELQVEHRHPLLIGECFQIDKWLINIAARRMQCDKEEISARLGRRTA